MQHEDKALISLLDSREEENIHLALLLGEQHGGADYQKRLAVYRELARLYCEAYHKAYDEAALPEHLANMKFKPELDLQDQPYIFDEQPYAWGGQSFGYSLSEAQLRYSIVRTLRVSNLHAWFKLKKQRWQGYDHAWTHCIAMLWVTFRMPELLPIFELVYTYWEQGPDINYWLAEIQLELKNYAQARLYYQKFLAQIPAGISPDSQFTSEDYYKKEYIPKEKWPELPLGLWFTLGRDTLGHIGAHPSYHALPPNSIEAHTRLAEIALAESQPELAETHYRAAIEICPQHWLAPHIALARLLLSRRPDLAADHLRKGWAAFLNAPNSRYRDKAYGGSIWYAYLDDYPRLPDFLFARYPLNYAHINYYYAGQLFFEAAQALLDQQKSRALVFDFLAQAANFAAQGLLVVPEKDTRRINWRQPHRTYRERPRLLDEILALLAAQGRHKRSKDACIVAYTAILRHLGGIPRFNRYAERAFEAKIQLIWQYYRDHSQIRWLLSQNPKHRPSLDFKRFLCFFAARR